jgi:Domain of unknown function (DUF1707)
MTTPGSPAALRASDAEREAVAARLRAAAAEGRLTLTEADERQAAAYAACTLDELTPLTADLPEPRPDPPVPAGSATRGPITPAAHRRFTGHAAVAAVLAWLLVTAWALGTAPFFWPAWPLFWLGLSLVVHHRRARRAPAAAGTAAAGTR